MPSVALAFSYQLRNTCRRGLLRASVAWRTYVAAEALGSWSPLEPSQKEPHHQCYHHRELPRAGPIPSRAPLLSSLLSSTSSSSSSPPPASAPGLLPSHPRGNPNPLLAQEAYDGDSPRERREPIRARAAAAAAAVLGHVEPCQPIDGFTPRHPPCSRATYDLSSFFHVFQFLQHLRSWPFLMRAMDDGPRHRLVDDGLV
jgi:hypothetical protein